MPSGRLLRGHVWTLQAKEERLAEKAKKKAAAKKMEEVEARRKQKEEARRLRWLQQVRSGGDREGVGWGRHCFPAMRTGCACPFCRVDPVGSCG